MILTLSILILLFALVDVGLTRYGIKQGHPELNPLARWFSMKQLYAARIGVGLFLAVTGYLIGDTAALARMVAVFGIVAGWNVVMILLPPRRRLICHIE